MARRAEVAAVFIVQRQKILLVHNPKWGAYSLPMTKRQRPDDEAGREYWAESAQRALVEILGPLPPPLTLLGDFGIHTRVSLRTKKPAHYRYVVYGCTAPRDIPVLGGPPRVWMTPAQIQGDQRYISPTAQELLALARIRAKDRRMTLWRYLANGDGRKE